MLKNSWALFPVIVFLSEGKRSQHKPNRHGWKMLVPLNKSVTIEGSCACREHNHTDQRYSGGEQTPDTDFFCNNDGRGLGNFTRALSSVAEVTLVRYLWGLFCCFWCGYCPVLCRPYRWVSSSSGLSFIRLSMGTIQPSLNSPFSATFFSCISGCTSITSRVGLSW